MKSRSEVLAALPLPWPDDVRPQIRELVALRADCKLVVLDDDPTGTQTVFDVPVLTVWDVDTLQAEFAQPGPCFYILTNSRSLVAADAKTLTHEIAASLRVASRGRPFTVVSRSDSTLRGHFPLETDALTTELGPFDATLIIPYFEAGGRCTIGDIHYVADGDALIPVAETPFAKDAAFGYRHSNLREWVHEKTRGRVTSQEVDSISIETLRTGGPDAVCAQLMRLTKGSIGVVNSAALSDMDVFALGLLQAENQGRRFLLRSAAQIVAARLALEARPLLNASGWASSGPGGGLVIVGSYVPKTTEQLSHLLTNTAIDRIELPVAELLAESTRQPCIQNALDGVHASLEAQRDVVLYTSRALVDGNDAADSLRIGHGVSSALAEIVQRLARRPRYFIAKGGITSSDLATRGLGVKRAIVAGQLLPGIPVWRLGAEAKFPELNYVVFPGNVGGSQALTQAVEILQSTTPSP